MSPTLKLWIVICGVGLTGVVTRCSFLFLSARLKLPPVAERALRYAPAAALGAIVVPGLVVGPHGVDLSLANPQWVAGLVAGVVMWRVRVMLWSMAAGLAAYTALRLLG
jgi:branched-subunit amino acid transport protein